MLTLSSRAGSLGWNKTVPASLLGSDGTIQPAREAVESVGKLLDGKGAWRNDRCHD